MEMNNIAPIWTIEMKLQALNQQQIVWLCVS